MQILVRIAAIPLLAGLLSAQSAPSGQQVPVSTFPLSCLLSKDGQFLFVLNSGVASPSISVIDLRAGKEVNRVAVIEAWLGLVLSPKGDRLYVGGGSSAAVYEFAFSDAKLTPTRTLTAVGRSERDERDFIGDLAFSPDGSTLYAADLYRDALIVINPATGRATQSIQTGRRPYRILFHPDGKTFFVSSWADGTVTRYHASDGSAMGTVRLGPHPTDMVWRHTNAGDLLYVAAANTNSVYSVNVPENGELSRGEIINVGYTADQPLGMTPSALGVSADSKTLYVVCSNANAVAQIDVSQERPIVTGFMATGAYPTAIQALNDGRLIVLAGRGKGAVSLIDHPSNAVTSTTPADLPEKPALPQGIKHVVLVVNERPTGDQELVTPNLHRLAKEFVRLDHFCANGDSAADGINWAVAGIASDYVEKLWPSTYGKPRSKASFEGGEPAALPPAGYLWGNAHLAGLTIRNYGFWVTNKSPAAQSGEQIAAVLDPQLAPNTDRNYRGVDNAYPDVSRATEFLRELHGFEQSGVMPQLTFVRMGSSGVADNDYAVGLLVDAVSHSRFWNDTAIFILELPSQNACAYVISPYTRRHAADQTIYNTVSILRTIELFLGLHPMTQFDANARVMNAVFQSSPVLDPFTSEKPSSLPTK